MDYTTSYECKKCDKNYTLSNIIIEHHYKVTCVPTPTLVSNCKTYGTVVYRRFPVGFKVAITGCIACNKGFFTNSGGTACTPYSFSNTSRCTDFNPYQNMCVKCSKGFTLSSLGTCSTEILNCRLGNDDNSSCLLCKDRMYWSTMD